MSSNDSVDAENSKTVEKLKEQVIVLQDRIRELESFKIKHNKSIVTAEIILETLKEVVTILRLDENATIETVVKRIKELSLWKD